MDFLPGGDLLEALLRTPSGRFTENEARVYIAEIVTVGGSGCSGNVAVWQCGSGWVTVSSDGRKKMAVIGAVLRELWLFDGKLRKMWQW
jgi:hypothetical protein